MSFQLPFDDDLLSRYINEQCTPEENRLIETYMENYLRFQEGLPRNEMTTDKAAVSFENMLKRKEQEETSAEKKVPKKKKRRYLIAAIFALLIGLSTYAFQKTIFNLFRPVRYLSITTTEGHRKSIWFPDSSHIDLDQQSSLRYSEDWINDPIREVWLEGQAYFDVHHNTAQPFRLHCGNTTITDIGTSFSVMNLSNKDSLTVAIHSGQVNVQSHNIPPTRLSPGDFLIVHPTSGKLIKEKIDTSMVRSWLTDIVMYNYTMMQVMDVITKHYHLNVRIIGDHRWMYKEQIIATIPPTLPVTKLLDFISQEYSIRYVLENRNLYIYQRGS